MQTKNDKQSFNLSFSMKLLATRGKEQSICEQTNQRTQTKCRFRSCSFFKTHKPLHANTHFSFQLLSCYECRKETKCTKSIKTKFLLLLRNEEYKQKILF